MHSGVKSVPWLRSNMLISGVTDCMLRTAMPWLRLLYLYGGAEGGNDTISAGARAARAARACARGYIRLGPELERRRHAPERSHRSQSHRAATESLLPPSPRPRPPLARQPSAVHLASHRPLCRMESSGFYVGHASPARLSRPEERKRFSLDWLLAQLSSTCGCGSVCYMLGGAVELIGM